MGREGIKYWGWKCGVVWGRKIDAPKEGIESWLGGKGNGGAVRGIYQLFGLEKNSGLKYKVGAVDLRTEKLLKREGRSF